MSSREQRWIKGWSAAPDGPPVKLAEATGLPDFVEAEIAQIKHLLASGARVQLSMCDPQIIEAVKAALTPDELTRVRFPSDDDGPKLPG